jgi:hypothetical protein
LARQFILAARLAYWGYGATRDQNGGFGFDTLIKKTW